jgi:hypothetical protein
MASRRWWLQIVQVRAKRELPLPLCVGPVCTLESSAGESQRNNAGQTRNGTTESTAVAGEMELTLRRFPANYSCVKKGTQDLRRTRRPRLAAFFALALRPPFCAVSERGDEPNITWNSVSGGARGVAVSRAVG